MLLKSYDALRILCEWKGKSIDRYWEITQRSGGILIHISQSAFPDLITSASVTIPLIEMFNKTIDIPAIKVRELIEKLERDSHG